MGRGAVEESHIQSVPGVMPSVHFGVLIGTLATWPEFLWDLKSPFLLLGSQIRGLSGEEGEVQSVDSSRREVWGI